jgi:molybdenum cofactor biosynthesis enzyme
MIYAFEEIGPDLSRPPMAARRALLCAGVSVPLETWQSLPIEVRRALVEEGTRPVVSEVTVKNLVSPVLKRIRFMGPVKDPPMDAIPPPVFEALRSFRPLSADEWRRLSPLDRYIFVALAGNSRLLYRAMEELGSGVLTSVKLKPWVGPLARAQVVAQIPALAELSAGHLMDGKALVLARTAGVRAARRAHEILDGYAEVYAGPVELDSRIDLAEGHVVFQAHVSTVDGAFFGAASVFAVATACAALRDALAQRDPRSFIEQVGLREEAWSVGSSAFGEEATAVVSAKAVYGARALAEVSQPGLPAPQPPQPPQAPPQPPQAPQAPAAPVATGFPGWIVAIMAITTLLSLAAAAATLLRR